MNFDAAPGDLPRGPEDQQTRSVKAQAAFLAAFAVRGNILRAAQAAKVGRRTVYSWLESDERFQVLYAEAEKDANDLLEDEARRRAMDGVLEPVYQGGEKVGTIRKYSDRLMEILLRGHKPEKYRVALEHVGKGGGPIQTQEVAIDPATLTDEELAVLEGVLARRKPPTSNG